MVYKEHDLRQDPAIGGIPREWEAVRLDEVAEIRNNKTTNRLEKIAFIPMELISESQVLAQYQVRRKEDVRSYTYCEAGDLLLAKITPSLENGKQGIVPSDVPNGVALATTEVFPINCKGIDSFFLFHVLKFSKFRNKIISSMTGTTGRQRASKESVEKLTIPLPPIGEQKAIVGVLGVVDLAIAKTGEVIAKTERLKKGLMQELLTKGIGHKEYKQTPIGMMPKEWDVARLGEITTKIKDMDHKMPQKQEEGVPFVSIKCMLKYPDFDFTPEFDDPDLEFISKEDYESQVTRFNVEKDDIIYSRFGSIGNAKLVTTTQPFIASYSIVLIKPNKARIDPTFLTCAMNSTSVKKQAKVATKGATNRNLHLEDIQNLRLPLPSLREQQKIGEILLTVEKKLELERKERDALSKVKSGLMDMLLTGKIRVKVD